MQTMAPRTAPGRSARARSTAAAGAPPAPTPYRVAARQLLRETLFGAARELLRERPWAEVTMAEVARAAGVSRQTLYKEFGSRDDFAQAFAIEEGGHFLDAVEQSVRDHFDDPRGALAAALELFLTTAAEDPLISLVLSDDGTGGMLPLVTTRSAPVVDWAADRLAAVIHEGWPQASEPNTRILAETLVRLAISHVTVPKTSPTRTAASIAGLLGPSIDAMLAGDAG
jgi:AcrR family transcriptional regulator